MEKEDKMEKRIANLNYLVESLRQQNKQLSEKYYELLDAYTDLVEEAYKL